MRMKNHLISNRQKYLFWSLFNRAWIAHAARKGINRKSAEAATAWRHGILEKITGQSSTKFLTQDDFDSVMLQLAIEACDEREIAYWAVATERRLRYLIRQLLNDMGELDASRTYDWSYVESCYSQANFPLTLDDAPAELLRPIYQMLFIHRRRLQRRLHRKTIVELTGAAPHGQQTKLQETEK